MIDFIDDHRHSYGVESICTQLHIAPSTYYVHRLRREKPEHLPDRIKRDQQLRVEIQRVWEENFRVYGARKVWRQLNREGFQVARCTVERLMKELGIHGVVRGKKFQTKIGRAHV